MGFLPQFKQTDENRRAKIRREILRHEAAIGGRLFGPLPKGHQRQFFCMDKYTWVWHESWVDSKGQRQTVTTRYDVRPSGVYKIQNGGNYQPLARREALNLYKTARLYVNRVVMDYQNSLPSA